MVNPPWALFSILDFSGSSSMLSEYALDRECRGTNEKNDDSWGKYH